MSENQGPDARYGQHQSAWQSPQQQPVRKRRTLVIALAVLAATAVVAGSIAVVASSSGGQTPGTATAVTTPRLIEAPSTPSRASSSQSTTSQTSSATTNTGAQGNTGDLTTAAADFGIDVTRADWAEVAASTCPSFNAEFESSGLKTFLEDNAVVMRLETLERVDGLHTLIFSLSTIQTVYDPPTITVSADYADEKWTFCADDGDLTIAVDSLRTAATGGTPTSPETTTTASSAAEATEAPPSAAGPQPAWVPTAEIEIAADAAVFTPLIKALNTGIWDGSAVTVGEGMGKSEADIAAYAAAQPGVQSFQLTFTDGTPASESDTGTTVVVGTIGFIPAGGTMVTGSFQVGAVLPALSSQWYLVILNDAW